ncbi:hypothetical protein AVEN_72008-1 [Araneus ventricosus]|uniref:Uncharacterized protein n=1 Tax=Araneus ventricosus TaxID=182803 RepID=A0A4Y2DF48_ARAVE|nr:hypothetical protein AVEN_72008-1 [Araneus ventricosus]
MGSILPYSKFARPSLWILNPMGESVDVVCGHHTIGSTDPLLTLHLILVKLGQDGYLRTTPAGGRLTTTYDLACNKTQNGEFSMESSFYPTPPNVALQWNRISSL